MTRFLSLLAGVLLLAIPAQAANWQKGCQSFSNVSSLQPGSFACNDLVADAETPMLSVSGCENIDVLYFKDLDAGGAGNTTINVYSCGSPTDGNGAGPTDAGWDGTGVCWIIENETLDGNPVSSDEAIYGAAAEWIYINPAIWDSATPRVIVRCNGPSN
jgi:hypothetical protein